MGPKGHGKLRIVPGGVTGRVVVARVASLVSKISPRVAPTSMRCIVTGAGHADARGAARARVRIAARYASDSLVVEGLVSDISPDGLFFCADYLDGAGEMARIWLEVPGQESPLELRGEVRWVSDAPSLGGMGIRLIDVATQERTMLSSFVRAAPAAGPRANRPG